MDVNMQLIILSSCRNCHVTVISDGCQLLAAPQAFMLVLRAANFIAIAFLKSW